MTMEEKWSFFALSEMGAADIRIAPREKRAMRWAARNIEPPKEVYSSQFTVHSLQFTVSEEKREKRKCNAEAQRAQRKRKAKRDGNTEITEGRTQRAQRRGRRKKLKV